MTSIFGKKPVFLFMTEKTRRFSYFAAGVILVTLTISTLFRLFLLSVHLPPGKLLVPGALVAHAAHIGLIISVSFLLINLVGQRFFGRVLISLALATFMTTLLIFDVAFALTSPSLNQVVSLRMLSSFHCGTAGVLSCTRESSFVLVLVGVLIFLLSAVILYSYRALTHLLELLVAPIKNMVQRTIKVPSRAFLPSLFLSYSVASVGAFAVTGMPIHARDPLYTFFATVAPPVGPINLLIGSPNMQPPVSPSITAKPKTLVLITVDALRADSVHAMRDEKPLMPFIQSQIESGSIKDLGTAIAICPHSYCGMIALQSSKTWAELGGGPPLMLGDVLVANGYTSVFFGAGRSMNYLNLGRLLQPAFDKFLDDSSPDSIGLADDREQITRLKKFAPEDPQRTYISIHLMSAHSAGLRFRPRGESEHSPGYSFIYSHLKEDYFREQYEDGVNQADWVIEQIFLELAKKRLLEDSLVIITADHGERLEVKPKVGHGEPLDLNVAQIPMLVYDSEDRDWPENLLISQIDVAPTFLKAASIDQPKDFLGTSLQTSISRNSLTLQSGSSRKTVVVRNGQYTLFD